jgi:hypothetical protein
MYLKDETPYNEKGQRHGLWKTHCHWIIYHKFDDEFWFECHYVNGVEYGYQKWGNGTTFYHAI